MLPLYHEGHNNSLQTACWIQTYVYELIYRYSRITSSVNCTYDWIYERAPKYKNIGVVWKRALLWHRIQPKYVYLRPLFLENYHAVLSSRFRCHMKDNITWFCRQWKSFKVLRHIRRHCSWYCFACCCCNHMRHSMKTRVFLYRQKYK